MSNFKDGVPYGASDFNDEFDKVAYLKSLASTATGQGASLVGTESGVTVQQHLPYASLYEILTRAPEIDGLIVNTAGFYAKSGAFALSNPAAAGYGGYIWDASQPQSNANGGTIIDPANTGGFDGTASTRDAFLAAQGAGTGTGCWVATGRDAIYVTMFGAVGNGAAADATAIQAAHDAIKKAGGGAISLGSKTYILDATLTVDTSYVSMRAEGATLDASAITASEAIHFTGSRTPPHNQTTVVTGRLNLIGPGSSNAGSIGARFETKNATNGEGPSGLALYNLTISGFERNTYFGDNAYIIDFYGCILSNAVSGVYTPASVTNGGERITFHGCTIGNSGTAVDVSNAKADIMLDACSLDYSAVHISTVGALVTANNCHLENNLQSVSCIVADGNGGTVILRGGQILQAGSTALADAYFETKHANAQIIVDDVFAHNISTTSDYLAKGPGRFITHNVPTRNISGNAKFSAPGETLMLDGGFEGPQILDQVFITNDSAAITDPHSGSDIKLTVDTAQFHSGAQSLKATKTYGAGAQAAFIIAVPAENFANMSGRVWFMSPTQTGALHILRGYGAVKYVNGLPTVPKNHFDSNGSFTVSSTWQEANMGGEPTTHIPSWATHFLLKVDMFNLGGGDLYLDDAVITKI